MIVRAPVEADAEDVRAIVNDVIENTTISFKPNSYSRDDVLKLFAEARCIRVAESDGRIVGYAAYNQFRNGLGYARCMEHSIALSKAARGRGVGRALMQEIENHARDAGIGSMWAGVSGENPAGVAFHARLGYETVAVLPKVGFKFNRWLDLTLMRKWLLEPGDADAPTN